MTVTQTQTASSKRILFFFAKSPITIA